MAVMERKMTAEEIGRRGEALYNAGIREKVETAENIGKFLALNVFTGEYAIDGDDYAAVKRGLDRDSEGLFYLIRIGYDAAHTLGGAAGAL